MAETPGGRRLASSLGEDALSLLQIDHGVKSMIHGDRMMSRSDASNYRPLATHVEETAARAVRLPASRMRSNSSRDDQLL